MIDNIKTSILLYLVGWYKERFGRPVNGPQYLEWIMNFEEGVKNDKKQRRVIRILNKHE